MVISEKWFGSWIIHQTGDYGKDQVNGGCSIKNTAGNGRYIILSVLPRLLSVNTSLTFLVMAYVSSSGDIATISWMLRPEWPGRGSGVPGWDSPPEGSSDGGFRLEDCEASGSPVRPLTDSSAELSGDSGAGLQLADVLGVPSAWAEQTGWERSHRLGNMLLCRKTVSSTLPAGLGRDFSHTTSTNLIPVKQTAKVLKFSVWSFFGFLLLFLHLSVSVSVALLCSSAGWKRAVMRSCQCTLAAVYTPREKERHKHARTHTQSCHLALQH